MILKQVNLYTETEVEIHSSSSVVDLLAKSTEQVCRPPAVELTRANLPIILSVCWSSI